MALKTSLSTRPIILRGITFKQSRGVIDISPTRNVGVFITNYDTAFLNSHRDSISRAVVIGLIKYKSSRGDYRNADRQSSRIAAKTKTIIPMIWKSSFVAIVIFQQEVTLTRAQEKIS